MAPNRPQEVDVALPRKAVLWQQLKSAAEVGVPIPFEKAYVQYTEDELQALVDTFLGDTYESEPTPADSEPAQIDLASLPTAGSLAAALDPAATGGAQGIPGPDAAQSGAPAASHDPQCPSSTVCGMMKYHHSEWARYSPETLARLLGVPFSDEASRRAGLTFNTHGPDDPLRVDSLGRVWYTDEVPKPARPLPRMVRKVRYIETGTEERVRRLPTGQLDESFEIPGSGNEIREIKITLPSNQVGVYKDPRLPFKLHIYGNIRGFDRMDIVRYFGGNDLVPSSIGTLYVGSDLCYDVKQTMDTMERMLRDLQLGRSY
jgi:hypothetical protein